MRKERTGNTHRSVRRGGFCLLTASVLLSGCSFLGREDNEKTELYFEKAQTLYDQGKTAQAVSLIMETSSADPLQQARRNWMLADMLGLTNSGIWQELIPGRQITLQNSSKDHDWQLLSVSSDNTKAMVLIESGLYSGSVKIFDLNTGDTLAVFGDDDASGSLFDGGCFKTENQVLLWANNELFQYDLADPSLPSAKRVLGLEEEKTEASDDEKSSFLEPEDGEQQNITQPKIRQIKPDGEKLYVLTDGGAAQLNPEDLEVEKQIYSKWVEFDRSPVWDVRDGKVAVAAAEVDFGHSSSFEAQNQKKSGVFLIDFTQENAEVESVSDQLTSAVSWGENGNLYAVQYQNVNPEDFSHIYIAPEKVEYKLVRFQGKEKKAESETFRMSNKQADIPVVFTSNDEGEYIAMAVGDEVQWRSPDSLNVEGSTVVMNPIRSLWADDGALIVSERGGILEKLAEPGVYPVTMVNNEAIQDFYRNDSGDFTALWQEGQAAGIESLKPAKASQTAVLDCENGIQELSYLEDPGTGRLLRMVVEKGQEETEGDHREQYVRCSVGTSGQEDLIWEKELTLSNQYDDSFGYENMVYESLMQPYFSLNADEKGVYAECVVPSEVIRVYLDQPETEYSYEFDEPVLAGTVSGKTGQVAVSTEKGLTVLAFDPGQQSYSVQKTYTVDAPWKWLEWNSEGNILVTARDDEISFLNTDTDAWTDPEGVSQGDSSGTPKTQISIYGISSYEPVVAGDEKNIAMFNVREGDSSDTTVWLADMETGKELGRISPDLSDRPGYHGFSVTDCDFADQDSQVILTDQTNTLYVWSVKDRKIIKKEAAQTFQNLEANPYYIQGDGDWVSFLYNGMQGYDYLSGSVSARSAVYRNENGTLIPWLLLEDALIDPEEGRAVVQTKNKTVEILLPTAEEIDAAAREYLESTGEGD